MENSCERDGRIQQYYQKLIGYKYTNIKSFQKKLNETKHKKWKKHWKNIENQRKIKGKCINNKECGYHFASVFFCLIYFS